MKKYRITAILLITILFLLLSGFSQSTQTICDDAELLSSSEEEELNREICELSEELEVNIEVVTTRQGIDEYNAQSYAENFFEDYDFSYEGDSGLLLLIDMESRYMYIWVQGKTEQYYSEKRTDKMVDNIRPALQEEEYEEAVEIFLEDVRHYMGREERSGIKNPFIQIGVSLAVAAVAVLIMYSGRKTKMTVNNHTYLDGNRANIVGQNDIYTHTTTITRKIETQSSSGRSGGGSSSGSGGGHGSGGHF